MNNYKSANNQVESLADLKITPILASKLKNILNSRENFKPLIEEHRIHSCAEISLLRRFVDFEKTVCSKKAIKKYPNIPSLIESIFFNSLRYIFQGSDGKDINNKRDICKKMIKVYEMMGKASNLNSIL